MNDDNLITNVLTLAFAGLLILLTGLSVYFLRDFFARYFRFLFPVPPLAVAAYIYVFKLFEAYDGALTIGTWGTLKDVMLSALIAVLFYTSFTLLLVFIVNIVKKVMV